MKSFVFAVAALVASAGAHATIPQFRATCPTGILAAGGGNSVFINGKQAAVTDRGNNNFSAKAGGISLDFAFYQGEPSLSYTAPKGANGMCTVTKFQPAAAPAARKTSTSGSASSGSMSAECKGFASEKFGVKPSYISVHPAFKDHGMYSMYGDADGQNFICTFDGNGKFVAVDSSGNPDGDL
jgi:hypothetical protein